LGGLLISGELGEEFVCDNEHCPPSIRDSRGCKADAPYPLFYDIPGYGDLSRCPVAMLTETTWFVLRCFNACCILTEGGWQVQGQLPFSGGYQEQPHTLLLALEKVRSVVNKVLMEKRKERENERNQ
jgi:hypothetical protein